MSDEPFSYHDYQPTWRSYAHKVDLRPVARRLDTRVAARLQRINVPSQKKIDFVTTEVAAQAAAAIFLGGQSKGNRNVVLRSGHTLEVYVESKRWPYTRWAPSAAVGNDRPPREDPLLVACPFPPFTYEEAWVCGWVPVGDWRAYAERMDWGHRIRRWRPVAELLNDELANPRLPVGMSRRRHEKDPGIPEYVEHYFGPAPGGA